MKTATIFRLASILLFENKYNQHRFLGEFMNPRIALLSIFVLISNCSIAWSEIISDNESAAVANGPIIRALTNQKIATASTVRAIVLCDTTEEIDPNEPVVYTGAWVRPVIRMKTGDTIRIYNKQKKPKAGFENLTCVPGSSINAITITVLKEASNGMELAVFCNDETVSNYIVPGEPVQIGVGILSGKPTIDHFGPLSKDCAKKTRLVEVPDKTDTSNGRNGRSKKMGNWRRGR